MQSFQIEDNQAGQRLDKFLHKFMPDAGSGFLYKMLRKKNIVLNGKKAEGKEMLAVGDTVSFFFSDETYFKFTGRIPQNSAETAAERRGQTSVAPAANTVGTAMSEKLREYKEAYKTLHGITILYEDKNILVLNKPAGILTQKDDSGIYSVNEWMIGYLLFCEKLTEETLYTFKPSVQNRLDRNTTGIVLCGISLAGSQLLARLIHDRSIRKYYYTIVKGTGLKETELKGYLIKDKRTNSVRVSQSADGGGSPIRTLYTPVGTNKDITCLKVELITGKTHQIRAHMASAGHPILGDNKYGDREWNASFKKKYGITHQLLHAARIEFPKLEAPFTELSEKVFKAELPAAFEEVLKNGNMEFQGP